MTKKVLSPDQLIILVHFTILGLEPPVTKTENLSNVNVNRENKKGVLFSRINSGRCKKMRQTQPHLEVMRTLLFLMVIFLLPNKIT